MRFSYLSGVGTYGLPCQHPFDPRFPHFFMYTCYVPNVPNITLHRTVVHKDNFVDPFSGVHTQQVESAWSQLKYHVKREKGIRRADIQDFLNEEMWMQWRGRGSVFEGIIPVIARYYPL